MTEDRNEAPWAWLKAAGDPPELWDWLRNAGPEQRAALVPRLKAELDARVRSTPSEALPLAQRLVALAAGTGPGLEGLALRGQATAWHFNGRQREAQAAFLRAAELHLEAGQELEAAIAWRSLVEVDHQLGRRDEALEMAARARATFERLGAEQLLAELDVNVGNVLVRLDEYAAAREHHQRALERFERLGHALGQSYCRFNLALVAMNLSQLEEARGLWLEARAAMAAAGQELHVADCDYNLAYLRSRSGDFRGAIEGLLAARAGYLRCGKAAGVPLCDLDLAEIHLRLGALELASERAELAAASFAEQGLELERARSELILGLCRARRGQHAQARALIEGAAARFLEVGNRNSAALAELELAALDIERGLAGLAQRRARAARHQFEERGLNLLRGLATLVLARAALQGGEAGAALAELERMAELPERRGLGGLLEIERLVLAARAEERLGRRDRAIERLRHALATIDDAYPAIPGQEVRLAFLRGQHAAFLDLVFLLGRRGARGDAAEALGVLEDGRLHSHEGQALEQSAASPAVRALRERIELLLARRLDSELGLPQGPAQVRGAAPDDGQLENAWQAYRRAKGEARGEGLRRQLDADALLAACPPGERLVAYAIAPDTALALVAEEGRVRAVLLPTGALELCGFIDRLRFHMDRLRLGGEFLGIRAEQFQRTSDQLFEALGARLLAPLFDPQDERPLTIVPYGLLHDLPFQAFRLGGAPLIERAAVSFAPGLRGLAEARGAAPWPPGPLLLMDAGGAGLSETPAELAALEQLYPADSRRLSLAEFSDPAAFECPPGAGLHVAGHGLFVPDQPQFSALSDGQRFLFAHDLAARRLPLNLVVLSGCETGRQGGVEAEELVGLSRAFLAAGARAVLASLWPVEDRAARRFMTEFYGALAAGLPAREALAAVQRAWLAGNPRPDPAAPRQPGQNESEALRLPHLWAAFALAGDPRVRLSARPREPR
jgi:tetratricopeptide (TPR) repeat protein